MESRQVNSSTNSKRPDIAPNHKNIFLGKLVCAECGEPMYADKRCSRAGSNTPSQIFYECKTYKKSSRGKCSSHYLTDAVLTEIVERAIQHNTNYVLKSSACAKALSDCNTKTHELKWKLVSLRRQEEHLQAKMSETYDLYMAGKIPKSELRTHLNPISNEQKSTEKWIEQIAAERKAAEQEYYNMNFCQQAFLNYDKTHTLTKDIADAMFDRIEVRANKDVVVHFKFVGVYFTDSAQKD